MFQNGFIVWLILCTASFPIFSLSRLNLQTSPGESRSSISYKMQRPTSVPTKCMSCPFHPYQTISKHLMQLPCHPRHSLRRWSSSLFCQIRWLLSDLRYRLGHVQGQTAKHVENIRKQGIDWKMTMFDYHWLSTNTIQSNSWVQKKFQNVSEWFHCLVDPVHCLFSIFP